MDTSSLLELSLLALASAEAFFVVTRAEAILVSAKRADQRTEEEQSRIARGLTRSLCLEALVFVPTSCFLVLMLTPLLPQPLRPPSSAWEPAIRPTAPTATEAPLLHALEPRAPSRSPTPARAPDVTTEARQKEQRKVQACQTEFTTCSSQDREAAGTQRECELRLKKCVEAADVPQPRPKPRAAPAANH
jgi:hypothetical protein